MRRKRGVQGKIIAIIRARVAELILQSDYAELVIFPSISDSYHGEGFRYPDYESLPDRNTPSDSQAETLKNPPMRKEPLH